MLHEFLTTNRVALIDRCRLMVARRRAPKATGRELEHGIPLFLDQLITTLRAPDQRILALNDRLGSFAHELRNLVHTATLAVAAIKGGNVGITGATGAVLDKCLLELRNLIDRSLADVRITAGLPAPHKVVPLSDVVAQIEAVASLEARERECTFSVAPVDKGLAVDADLETLLSAVAILLQNAFKFTQHHTEVSLNAYASADRILIDVEDHCGGLPPGAADNMNLPFKQNGNDKSGLGLGLTICRHSVEANNGVLRVRDVPGSGCVFTIELAPHGLT
jgi:signal transduction histidine kinase